MTDFMKSNSQFYFQCWNRNSISSVEHRMKQYAVLCEQNKTCLKCKNSTGPRDVITPRQEGTETTWEKSVCILLLPPLPKADSSSSVQHCPQGGKYFCFLLLRVNSVLLHHPLFVHTVTPQSKRNRQCKKHEVWLFFSNRFLSLQNTYLCLKALQAYIKANNQWLYALSILQFSKIESNVLSQLWLKYPLLWQETQIFEITN